MGFYKRSDGIKCFKPDDTDTKIYIKGDYSNISLTDLLQKATEKWGDIDTDLINISSKYIHTQYIGYDQYDPSDHIDQYDPSDYSNYIVLELKK